MEEISVISSGSSIREENEKIQKTKSESSSTSNARSNAVSEKFEYSSKSDITNKSYKEKISKRFKSIREETIRNHNLKTPNAKTSKNRSYNGEKVGTFKGINNVQKVDKYDAFAQNLKFFIEDTDEVSSPKTANSSDPDKNTAILSYSLPQTLNFEIKLSEKDSYLTTNSNAYQRTRNKEHKYLQEGIYVNENNMIKKRHVNLLRQKLLAMEDRKWFNSYDELEFYENPLSTASIRPNKEDKAEIYNITPVEKEKCNEIVIIKENILQIYLTELKFTSHPLFSIEHVLAEKLTDLYEQYLVYNKNNNMGRIRSQLEALRYLRQNVMNKNRKTEDHTKRIVSINKDIKNTRKSYFEQGRRERENLKNILNTWRQIKRIREKQKFINTNVKLVIKKENVDYELDNSKYEKLFKETLQEIIKEIKFDIHETSKKILDNVASENAEENSAESTSSGMNGEDVKRDLESTFRKSLRPPGEPLLRLSLTNDNEITKVVEYKKELQRRNSVKSTKIRLNILCNKIEVCQSKPLVLNDDFLLDINERFSIQLQEVPKCLVIEIFEQPKGAFKKKLCEVSVTLPAQTTTFSLTSCKPLKEFFQAEAATKQTDRGEPAEIDLSSGGSGKFPTGYIEYCLGWEKTASTKKDSLKEEINLLKDITDKNLVLNVNKLSEWMGKTFPDPQDPGNVVFFEYMANYDTKLFRNNDNFRLSPHIDNLSFCNISEIDQNRRFKILRLRNRNEIEFEGVVVPNRVKEISLDILDGFKKHKREEQEYVLEESSGNEIEAQRKYGLKFLKQYYTKLFQKCKNSENNLVYESVVDEKYLAHFEILVKTLQRNFFSWFHWQPTKPVLLKPSILPKKKAEDDHHDKLTITKQCNVVIKIISGKNIPGRKKYTFDEAPLTDVDSSKSGMTENEVRPFIEVSYGGIFSRTSSSTGTTPVWNETLTLPLEYQNVDYLNPESLNGTITVNLYDECDQTLKYHNKKCYNWLGAVEIPLSAICHSTSMSGLFKVRLPQLLLGYETEMEKYLLKSPKHSNMQSYALHTYVQMELGIVPNVPKLMANLEDLPCGDVPYIQQHIVKWNKSYNESFPNRKFSALAIDTNAKTVCITRYLKPLEPPQINLEGFDVTPEQCSRYVSLIPFTACNQFYNNVWLSTDQLLQFMVGSVTDHAVALTCYLLAIKMDAWLLLGYGIPHGSTAYVLTQEYVKDTEIPTYCVYDVVYNEKYNLTDPHCPLQRIYCLANGENVWANMQRSDNVQLTRFDLSRKSDWFALFNNNVSAPSHFINKVTYRSKMKVDYLERQIEMQIRKKITKLRQLDRTIWNDELRSDLNNVLRSFEIHYMHKNNQLDVVKEINEKISAFKVNGYVLNIAYLSTSDIIKNIKKLGIYNRGGSSIEFALAVYIHSYHGPLLSTWIFIGNISRKLEI